MQKNALDVMEEWEKAKSAGESETVENKEYFDFK